MISLTTSEAANAMGGQQFGPNEIFTGVSTDSRTVQPGEIFFALKGERFDGHEMCVAAYQQGAVASVVERKIVTKKTCVKVSDTRHALGKLAHYWRNKQRAKLIGITGSNGKTTTKELINAV